ncbi:MAG: fibrobacter succinogenes major paralogous domain-containing protein [Flavobacterium sp.]
MLYVKLAKIFLVCFSSIVLFSCSQSEDNSSDNSSDQQKYTSVVIGDQVWMKANLGVSKYQNGDVIPQVQDAVKWANSTQGAWCYYENDTKNGKVYGKLYNWFAVNDPRGLAPKGWHIPSVEEWTVLIDFLGGTEVAGGSIKSTALWNSPNAGAANSVFFNALPGGWRENTGSFFDKGSLGLWWTVTEIAGADAWFVYADSATPEIVTGGDFKRVGFSVRCVKD